MEAPEERAVSVSRASAAPVQVTRVEGGRAAEAEDTLAVEEPLEIRLGFGPSSERKLQTISLTMRTPGSDAELAAGFLFTEGIIRSEGEISSLKPAGPPVGPGGHRNVIRVELRPEVEVDLGRLQRHFYTTSSCGVCGKTSLEALAPFGGRPRLEDDLRAESHVLYALPPTLREAQNVFGQTGGLHACGLFDAEGQLIGAREDVGRHNALDKLVGSQLLEGRLPLQGRIILLSGRASFELLQKAFVAGAPLVAAVGAPSSLAVELAERYGITLVGWLRGERFSVYTHAHRIRAGSQE